ncbi:MAG: hypothetical protein M8349_06695 [ANME-2 cluster archaeon]|nr:hypothetical protein [ANME-2 cluster archaeon]
MLALKNLIKNRVRTTLNIAAVTIAVLSVILLASLGSGLVSTGEQDMSPRTAAKHLTPPLQ